jgi:maltose/moltooligosaccharide transporter
MAKQKPRLSFWQIWNMSFGFLGIQFGFALQNANTSRIFETLGADVGNLAIYWIAAPLTGLIVQPIIGYYSDRTWHPKWGRRRPFFLVGAILASIALCFMPNSPELWVAIGMLWIMDASINVSMEPFRAFVGDNLPDEQRTTGFVTQSFFIGIGAVVASMLPWMMTNWLGISNTAPEGQIADSVKWSFYLGAIVFFGAVLWTVLKSKEYSPEELSEYTGEEEAFKAVEYTEAEYVAGGSRLQRIGTGFMIVGAVMTALIYVYREYLEKELFLLGFMIAIAGLLWIAAGALKKKGMYNNGFVGIMNDMLEMPKTMKQLAWVQFFSWFALFAMWIYTTSGVTSHIYGTSDTTSELYNKGADWVGILFAVYNGVAALVAFTLPQIAKLTSRKVTHLICLVLGGIGLISVYFFKDPQMLWIPMIGVGFAWASILSMPYAMLSGALPADKMGYYMGVFNFFIVIPQLVAATILGAVLGMFFGGASIYALFVGGAMMILAGLLTLRVDDIH